MPKIDSPSLDRLKRAVEVAEQIEKLQAELASILSGEGNPPPKVKRPAVAKSSKKGKRILSPEARERIAKATRARLEVRNISADGPRRKK